MEKEPFNEKQRDVFARMLEEAKDRAQEEFESDEDLEERVERESLPKLAKDFGATRLIAKVRKLLKETEKVEKDLRDLGFECTVDAIELTWKAPKRVRQAFEAAKRSARNERQSSIKTFDLAILGVWTAQTAEDARKIVEGLL